jgi:DNA polymerase-1
MVVKPVKPKVVKPKAEALPIYTTYEDFPFSDLLLYAGLDCIATSTLLVKMWPQLVDEPTQLIDDETGVQISTRLKSILDTNFEVTQIALDYIIDLELNGMQYDEAMNKEIANKMIAEVAGFDALLKGKIPEGLNLDSGTEVAKYLYGTLGFTPEFFTASGEPSTDGHAILHLAGLDPMKPGKYITPDPDKQFLAHMAKRKDISSTFNTFIKSYVSDWVKKDGRIHPQYNLHGTSGFRISGDSPNLLQLPRPKHGYNIRDCYTVRPGYCFIATDFSSAEVKILAALCGDENMLQAVKESRDFHSSSASLMMGIPYLEFFHIVEDPSHPKYRDYKERRQVAKVLTFSIIYGSSAGGIAFQLNVTKEKAEEYMKLFFEAYPRMKTFVEVTHNEALWNHRNVTPFGQRKQQFGTNACFKQTAAYNAALRNSVNVKVQSPTSTLGLIVFANLNEAIKKIGGFSTSTVYDSAELEVPIERAAEAIEIVNYYMNEFPQTMFSWLTLPIGSETELGTTWGNLKTVHRGITQVECEAILATMK